MKRQEAERTPDEPEQENADGESYRIVCAIADTFRVAGEYPANLFRWHYNPGYDFRAKLRECAADIDDNEAEALINRLLQETLQEIAHRIQDPTVELDHDLVNVTTERGRRLRDLTEAASGQRWVSENLERAIGKMLRVREDLREELEKGGAK